MRYAQGGQDAILQRVFNRIGVTNRQCVEFGFNADTLTGGSGANSTRLVLEEGWHGIFFDRDYQNAAINLYRETVTPESLHDIFVRHGVAFEPDYVSIDVDSIDLWLWKAMLQAGYRPRVVSVEYNSNYSWRESVTVRPDTVWAGDSCYGASLAALYRVGHEYGYALTDVEPVLDAFFIRSDLAASIPLETFAEYTGLPSHPTATAAREAAVMMEYR